MAAATAIVPPLLLAHTALRRAEPRDGEHVMAAPQRLVLEFTEVVELATVRLVLLGRAGDTVTLSTLRHADTTRRTIIADLIVPPRAGAHVIQWTVAGLDGHPVRGTVRFTIDTAATGLASRLADTALPLADTARPPDALVSHGPFDPSSPLHTTVRFLTFAAMLGLIGAAALRWPVIERAALDESARRSLLEDVRLAGLACAAALLVLVVVRLAFQTVSVHGALNLPAALNLISGTIWGAGWTLQAAGALTATVALGARGGTPFGVIALAAATAVALSAPLSGHAVASQAGAPLAVSLDAVHVLAVGAWLGTLAILVVLVLWRGHRVGGLDTTRRLFLAFSPVALTCGAVVLATGAVSAWIQLGGLAPLFDSSYGTVLLVKLAVVLALAVAGFLNWRAVLPRLRSQADSSQLRTTGSIEVVLAALVLVATAVLTATTPPMRMAP